MQARGELDSDGSDSDSDSDYAGDDNGEASVDPETFARIDLASDDGEDEEGLR